jgi:uncharacterized protein YodC (DUF2158 family)
MVDNPRDFQKKPIPPAPVAPAAFLDEPQPEHVKSDQLQEPHREFVFEPGDVIKLKSGGPDMTVHSYQRLDRGAEGVMSEIQTLWHAEDGSLHRGHFAHKTDEDLGRIFEHEDHEDEAEKF